MRETRQRFWTFPVTYCAGILIGLFVTALRLTGRLRIQHAERLPKKATRLLVVANHPSYLEAFLLPGFFSWEFLFHPIRFAPWNTPDSQNFRGWRGAWFGARSIPVPRKNPRGERRAIVRMAAVLRRGQRLILFPEGGRTSSSNHHRYTRNGKRMRPLKPGVGWLIRRTAPTILPLWVEGTDLILPRGSFLPKFWRARIMVKVGHAFRIPEAALHTKETITKRVEETILALADE